MMKLIKNSFTTWRTHIKKNTKITSVDIMIFFRQFSTLFSAGIPIIQCCDILENAQEKIAMRHLIYYLKRNMESGLSFSNGLKCHQDYFDHLSCQLIHIGEQSGTLDKILLMITELKEKNFASKAKIKKALFYPAIIFTMAIFITFGMLIFIVPRFAEIFQNLDSPLPALTQWIFYISEPLQNHLGLICIFLFLLIGFLFHKKERLAPKLQMYLPRFPIIKNGMTKIFQARFLRNLSITLAAGIPITDALKLSSGTINNREFSQTILTLRNKIIAGNQLHQAMLNAAYFSSLVIQMIKIGEESGKLESMLTKIAGFLEEEIDQWINRLGELAEPLIMLILGVLIGGLVIGMYLPIFKLGTAI